MAGLFGKNKKAVEDVKRIKLSMIIYYAFIIIGITAFIAVSTISKTDDVLMDKVSDLATALNVQMQMNLNSYLDRVETMATLVFAEKDIYTYDATNKNNDEYEALNMENYISEKLHSLCLMENFVDFAIIYRNNHTVGKLSNNTKELFGNLLYSDLCSAINRWRTSDGWIAGYTGNYHRIYYVKRVNNSAVLLTSFYATELEDVFDHPGGLADMTVQLIDSNNMTIYSSVDGLTGATIAADISNRVSGHSSATLIDNDYLVSVAPCGDNWRVVSSIPTQIILQEKNTVQLYILSIGAIAAIIAIALSMILSFGVSSSVDKTLTTLDEKAHVDQLTGVLNKVAFEARVDSLLKQAGDDARYAMLIIDVDDFKTVNDTFGHAYGDDVLAGVGAIMHNTFRAEDSLGRLGGDEFCVCMSVKGSMSEEDEFQLIHRKCTELGDALRKHEIIDGKQYNGSVSMGVSIYPENGKSFDELYRTADKALYASKRQGKDSYTIYKEET